MAEIGARFESGHGIAGSSLPLLASGECFHLSENDDPNVIQYGVILLDAHGDKFFMDGAFAFFHTENPYRNWDLAAARTQLNNIYQNNHQLFLESDFAFADMNPQGETIWRYWLKQANEQIFLMGQWGSSHRVLCELIKHKI